MATITNKHFPDSTEILSTLSILNSDYVYIFKGLEELNKDFERLCTQHSKKFLAYSLPHFLLFFNLCRKDVICLYQAGVIKFTKPNMGGDVFFEKHVFINAMENFESQKKPKRARE